MDHSRDVLDLMLEIMKQDDLPLTPEAELFLLFLANHDRCSKAGKRRNKRTIDFSPDICKGCHALPFHVSYYQHVLAPSTRVLDKLKDVARVVPYLRAVKVARAARQEKIGEAAMRGFLASRGASRSGQENALDGDALVAAFIDAYLESLQVEIGDVLAVAPFIFMGKININEAWISREFKGSAFDAVEDVVLKAFLNFSSFFREHGNEHAAGDMEDDLVEEILAEHPEYDVFFEVRRLLDLEESRSDGREERRDRQEKDKTFPAGVKSPPD